MQPQMALLWEVSPVEFVLVTLVIGGALAYAVGRATARGWEGWSGHILYILLLAVAIRFLHFSLFDGSFFLPPETFGTAMYYALVDLVVLLLASLAGRVRTRSGQMRRQYGFLRTNRGQVGAG